MTFKTYGTVTFALRGADGAEHASMVARITETGFATLTSTTIGSRSVLRLCTLNPLTTVSDLEETLRRLLMLGSRPPACLREGTAHQ